MNAIEREPVPTRVGKIWGFFPGGFLPTTIALPGLTTPLQSDAVFFILLGYSYFRVDRLLSYNLGVPMG